MQHENVPEHGELWEPDLPGLVGRNAARRGQEQREVLHRRADTPGDHGLNFNGYLISGHNMTRYLT